MAKRGRLKGFKGVTKEERIARLTESLPNAQVKMATSMAKDTPWDVLNLAHMMAARPTHASGVRGLSKTINALPEAEQEKAREYIAAIKKLGEKKTKKQNKK